MTDQPLAERIADAARTVRLHLGPNAVTILKAGGTTALSGGEADDIAAAVLAVVQPELDRLRALVDRATVFEIPRPTGAPLQLRQQGFGDRWAICDRTGRRLGREGRWWHEPEREDLCDDNRFTLAEALSVAEQLAAAPRHDQLTPHCRPSRRPPGRPNPRSTP